MAERKKRVTSVLELARYKQNELAYCLSLFATGSNTIVVDKDHNWVKSVHPKVLYERKIANSWKYRDKLPKLAADEFQMFVIMLTSRLAVNEFIIVNCDRCTNTGEYYYQNSDGEWIPESCLFDSAAAAKRERERILKLMRKWVDEQLGQ